MTTTRQLPQLATRKLLQTARPRHNASGIVQSGSRQSVWHAAAQTKGVWPLWPQLNYLVRAKSTGELISFWFSDRSVPSLVSAINFRSANRWVQTKNDFTFWLIFGLSPNIGLSESISEKLIQKVKSPINNGECCVLSRPSWLLYIRTVK